ncbi:Isocitrate dehydrogenase [NAD] subunit gamma 1, mitochondrial, partial [Stegodyphus mimosarum]
MLVSRFSSLSLLKGCQQIYPILFTNHKSFKASLNRLQNISTGHADHIKAKYGGRFMVSMLPGDGIGPELMGHVKEIFRLGGVPVDFEEVHLDSTVQHIDNVEEAIISIKRNGVAIKGNIETRANNPQFRSRNVILRLELNLFVNVLHCKSQPGIKTRHSDIDIVLIRQNTEGEYSCLEHESVPGVIESLKIVTREKSEEIARFAFDYAVQNNRKKVTAVHKANIMKLADGLFLKTCSDIAKEYPQIEFDSIIIDNCSMQLVSNPHQFDVLLLPNLYGNILNNIACGLVGGPGIISGQNYGHEYAVFETGSRNTGKGIAGKNIANPVAMLNASVDLLQYLGLEKHAKIIGDAVFQTVNIDKIHTPDLGGTARTSDVVENVIKIVQ